MYGKIAFLMLLATITGLISPIFFNRTLRDKTEAVASFLNEIGSGNLDAKPQEIAIDDEISRINHDVDDMRQKLKKTRDELLDLNLTLEEKVADRTEELQAAMEELEAMNENLLAANEELESTERIRIMDLSLAASVQKSFLPEVPPPSDEYDIAFTFRPASQVSGDFYDFYAIDGKLAGAGIYDVSGHGISSGLLTIIARSIIQRNFTRGINEKLGQVMDKINKILITEIGQSDKYITGIMLRFRDGHIEYVNSGHPDAFYKIGNSDKTGKIVNKAGESVKGMFMGVAAMEQPSEVLNIRLNKGDSLFIFSDCFIETPDANGRAFGEDGINAALKLTPGPGAREILDFMIDRLYEHAQPKNTLPDDLTAMVIRKK